MNVARYTTYQDELEVDTLGSRYNRSSSELHTTDTELAEGVRKYASSYWRVTHDSAIASDAQTGDSLTCPLG